MTVERAEASDDGIEIVRVFAAPRDRVWREWTTPEAFSDWFGASAEVPLESVSMDVRAGGSWSLKMIAEGTEIDWAGEYQEVEEPSRLVFTVTDRPDEPEYDLITVELSDLDDGRTRMRMVQSGGHMPKAGYERAMEGWGGFFDRIDERLAA